MATKKKVAEGGIKDLKPAEKQYLRPVADCAGLYVRVRPATTKSPKGHKSFVVVARNPKGEQKWREVRGTVIDAKEISPPLDEVRTMAREAIRRIKLGLPAFEEAPEIETFGSVTKRFLAMHVSKLRSRSEIERILNQRILPLWKDRDFVAIRKSDVARLLDDVQAEHGDRQAEYVRQIVRQVMNFHAERTDDYRPATDKTTSRYSPKEHERDRDLKDDELKLIWPVLDRRGTFGALCKVLLLTGQRRQKVAAMRWEDVSLEDGVWKIPKEKGEKNNAGTLVLPEMVIAILREQLKKRDGDHPYVFAGRQRQEEKNAGHFVGYSPAKRLLDEAIDKALNPDEGAKKVTMDPWRLHDLRRTSRTLMERAGVRPDVGERVLGHSIRGIEAVYNRYDYGPEKKAALDKLAVLVERIINPPVGNVVPIKAGSAG